MTREVTHYDSPGEEPPHDERPRHRRPSRRSLARTKVRALRKSLWRHFDNAHGRCDHLLADHEEAPAGAHLITPRIGYVHHGIYLGAGKVIHCGAVSRLLPRGPVEEVSLEDFGRGHSIRVRVGLPARFSAQEVVDRARSRLGENRYHLLRNNCEHFCEWCLRGRERSYQVERLMHWLRPWDGARGPAPSVPATACRSGNVQGGSLPFKQLAIGVD